MITNNLGKLTSLVENNRLIEKMQIPCWVKDDNREYVAVNSALTRMLGIDAIDILNSIEQLHQWSLDKIMICGIDDKIITSGKPAEYIAGYRTKAGKLSVCRVNADPLKDDDGKIIGILGYCVDIQDFRDRYLHQYMEKGYRADMAIDTLSREIRQNLLGDLGNAYGSLQLYITENSSEKDSLADTLRSTQRFIEHVRSIVQKIEREGRNG